MNTLGTEEFIEIKSGNNVTFTTIQSLYSHIFNNSMHESNLSLVNDTLTSLIDYESKLWDALPISGDNIL